MANIAALLNYFGLSKIETQSEGFFNGIFELQPGHVLCYDLTAQQKTIEKYYLTIPIEAEKAQTEFKAQL